MAVTKIKAIKTNLKKALDYIMDESKTDGKLLVTGGNCAPEVAYLEFKMTEETCNFVIGDRATKSKNLGYHMIQSFDKKDKITPEEAHRIGIELAEKFIGSKHEYVVTTHIDKGHIHNHIIFNAYSYSTYRKFNCHKNVFKEIRAISDELCKENGLSIVEDPKGKGKSYKEYLEFKKGTSWKAQIKETIDLLINNVKSFEEFKKEMNNLGFEIKEGKHISFKAPNQERYCRGKTIGENYTREKIEERIKESNKNINLKINKSSIFMEKENYYIIKVPAKDIYIKLDKESIKIKEDYIELNSLVEEYKLIDVNKSETVITRKEVVELFKNNKDIKNDSIDDISNIKLDKNIFVERKQKIKEVKDLANSIIILRKEGIISATDLKEKLNEIKNERDNIIDLIKTLEEKNNNFKNVSKYLITYNKYKDIYEKYGNKKNIFRKNKFEDEIELYQHAEKELNKLGINTNVDINKLKEKIANQENEIKDLTQKYKSIAKKIDTITKADIKIKDVLNEKREKEVNMEI